MTNENFDFSPDELGLLILTNDGIGPDLNERSTSGIFKTAMKSVFGRPVQKKYFEDRTYVLTTKETYFWGIVFSRIVQKKPDVREEVVINAFRKALQRNSEFLKKYYGELPKDIPFRFSEQYFHNYERLYIDTLRTMQEYLKVELNLYEIYEAQRKAFRSLVDNKYIEDPIFTSFLGFSIAIVGFIPYGFTKQTRKGQTVYRKIQAMVWSYERDERKIDNATTKINFRLWKVLTAFKKALAEETEEEIEKK